MKVSVRAFCGILPLLFAVAVCGFSSIDKARAAAWALPEKSSQLISTVSVYTTKTFYDTGSDSVSRYRYSKLDFSPYYEYGFYDDLTLGITTGFQDVIQEGPITEDENSGISDFELFYRQLLWKDENSVFSYQPLIKIPGIYDKLESPIIGQGQVDLELRGLYGRNFIYADKKYFTNAELAYRYRDNDPEDEIRLDLTLGINTSPKNQILLQSFNTFSLDLPAASSFQPANSSDYNLNKLQFSVVREFTKDTAIQVGFFGNVYGANTGGGGGVLFAVWKNF